MKLIKREYLQDLIDIDINFNLVKFDNLRDYMALNNYIEENYIEGKINFVLIDEVQMCKDFERTIHSIHAEEKYDIYITGSNAFLLSSDLATLFTGRTFCIDVYPFSFKEYLEYYQYNDIQEAFDNYVKEGGMSGSYLYKTQKEKYDYISDVYNTLIVRDINQKYKIRNIDVLNNYLMDNISNLTSSNNITNVLNNNNVDITDKTISNYIKYLCNAFVFYKVTRYDIRGKKLLSTQD